MKNFLLSGLFFLSLSGNVFGLEIQHRGYDPVPGGAYISFRVAGDGLSEPLDSVTIQFNLISNGKVEGTETCEVGPLAGDDFQAREVGGNTVEFCGFEAVRYLDAFEITKVTYSKDGKEFVMPLSEIVIRNFEPLPISIASDNALKEIK